LSAFAFRDYRLLWTGQLLSNLGSWLLVVAVPYHVFRLTGSTVATASAFVAETLPALVLGPVAGVFADRWERRRVLLVSDLLRAGCVLLLVLVRSPDMLWLLYVAVFAENAAGQFFRPAKQALIPAIVDRGSDLSSANSLSSLVEGVVRLGGAPLGGVLYALTGFTGVVVLDAVSYLASAVLIALVRVRSRGGTTGDRTVGAVLVEFRDGARHVWRSRLLRGQLLVAGCYFAGNGALTALLVPFLTGELGGGSQQLGLVLSALGVGFLIGAPLSGRVADRITPRTSTAGALAVLGLCFFGMFNAGDLLLVTVLAGLAGIPGVILLVGFQTQVQRLTPDALLGRVSAAFGTAEMAATVAGSATAGALAGALGLGTTLNAAIGLILAAAVAAVVLFPAGHQRQHEVLC